MSANSAPSLFRPHDEAPPRVSLRVEDGAGAYAGLDTRRFEFVSRGDFTLGVLHLPESASGAPAPLALLLHPTDASAEDPALDFAADWVRRGLAVARIDLPLHGRRASPKLSARLTQGYRDLAAGKAIDADTRALVQEFARQCVSDVTRGLEAIGALPEIDDARMALAGRGIGAAALAWSAPHASEVRAHLLVGDLCTFPDPELDPGNGLAARCPSTGSRAALLLITGSEDDVEAGSVAALFDRAAEPKEELVSTSREERIDLAYAFLAKTLGL